MRTPQRLGLAVRVRLKRYQRTLEEGKQYVLRDYRTGEFVCTCHTTGATYFSLDLKLAEVFGKQALLQEMVDLRSHQRLEAKEVVSWMRKELAKGDQRL